MEICCLKGACSSPRLFGVVISSRAGARNSGDRPEVGLAGSWAYSTLMSIFFSSDKRVLCFA